MVTEEHFVNGNPNHPESYVDTFDDKGRLVSRIWANDENHDYSFVKTYSKEGLLISCVWANDPNHRFTCYSKECTEYYNHFELTLPELQKHLTEFRKFLSSQNISLSHGGENVNIRINDEKSKTIHNPKVAYILSKIAPL